MGLDSLATKLTMEIPWRLKHENPGKIEMFSAELEIWMSRKGG